MNVSQSKSTEASGVRPQLSQDDKTLARLAAEGDMDAAGQLIDRYEKRVRSFLLKLSRRPEIADDISQETFLRMLRHIDRYDPSYPMITWLFTIARRLFLNHIRRSDNRTVNTDYEYFNSSYHDPATIVAETDQQAQTKMILDQAIEKLPESQQSVILLYHQQELPISEIAQVMKMPEGTVKSHLHRARSALRLLIKPQLEKILP